MPEHYVPVKRVRRKAARQLLRLKLNRRRDPRSYDYGTCRLIGMRGHHPIEAETFPNLEAVEHWLDRPLTKEL
jgi:hypothetical protein